MAIVDRGLRFHFAGFFYVDVKWISLSLSYNTEHTIYIGTSHDSRFVRTQVGTLDRCIGDHRSKSRPLDLSLSEAIDRLPIRSIFCALSSLRQTRVAFLELSLQARLADCCARCLLRRLIARQLIARSLDVA